jgi:hypothetical protein
MLRFLSHAPVFLACLPPTPLVLFSLNLPCRLADAADAFSGMANTDVLLLLLLLLLQVIKPPNLLALAAIYA